MFDIVQFLKLAVTKGASDIHLRTHEIPAIRINGLIIVKTNYPELTAMDMDDIINSLAPENIKENLNNILDIDFSYEIPGYSRFRINICREKGQKALVIRVIPYEIPVLKKLNLPPFIEKFTKLNNGIILVTGPTGSGKSTTLAALLDLININDPKHIITLEDPIEFIHSNKKSIFTQRQLGVDTKSFPDGLKYALRQDPDVILIGEMRDRETILSALKAAETGHIVFSTLHTNDAVQTVNRIINTFEPHERDSVRQQVAATLKGIIAQKLVKRADETGRVPAVEVLTVTPTVKNYIEKNELENIYDLIRIGSVTEMITMNMSLYRLVKAELVTKEDALEASNSPNELEQMFRGVLGSIENKQLS
jgi:twitching motility protein PilT